MLDSAEQQELSQLTWMHQYYCDSWLGAMAMLDALRPTVQALAWKMRDIIRRLEIDEIDIDKAQRLQLFALREWLVEYRQLTTCVRSSPN